MLSLAKRFNCFLALALSFLWSITVAGQQKENFKVALFLYPGVELLDFAGPGEVFSSTPGFSVYTVTIDGKAILSQRFVTVTPNYAMDKAPEPDIIIFPGGGAGVAANNPKVIEWVQRIVASGGTAMSVCTGAFVLAKAGLLNGLTVTTHYGSISALQKELPQSKVLEHTRFIDNGNIMTTAGVSAGIDGALYMVARIKGVDVAKATAHYMEYDKWDSHYGNIAYENEYITQLKTQSFTPGKENKPVFKVAANAPIPYEGELRNLAADFMDKGKYKEAARVLETTVTWYPNSVPSYHQLSEVYGKLGKSAPIAESSIMKWIDAGKMEEAYAAYKKAQIEYPGWKIFNENKLNGKGYEFLQKENYDMAIKIFQLNLKAFPQSWNAWDSLAEGYMKAGNKKEAITHYKKSLELNPENNNAKEMLIKCESM